jgi:hypothetical protein
MKNLKKVLALVVAVAMLASFGFVASASDYSDVAYDASYADAVNLLSNLGLIKGYEDGTFRPDNTITRAEVAAIMVRMLAMEDSVESGATAFTDVAADNWASGYINVAYAQGIIKGMGDGTFAPNAEVTYEQIVKMIVCALGYEPAAEQNGSYPTGYLYQASKIGLTKGVAGTTGKAASRATVAKLVYNALEIDLMEQATISTGLLGPQWEIKEGKTILTEYLDLEKVDGVITSTYLSNPEYEAGDNEVTLVVTKNYASSDVKIDYEVGDVINFVADNTDAATLLGYTVVAYVGENEDGDDEIFAVAEKAGKNTLTTIDTDLITSLSDDEVVYSKSKTAKNDTTASIESEINLKKADDAISYDNLIINGFESSAYTSVSFTLADYADLDDITFLDNDGDGDFEYIFVTVFNGEEFVVDSIDADEYYIEGVDEGELSLDYDDDDVIVTIIKDGRIVDFSDIAENDVVTILDKNVNVKTVYVSSTVVEGTVDEVDDDTFTISGKDYKVSPNQTFVADEDISAGDEGIYYINYLGKIAYVDTVNSISSADYVYIIDADSSEGDFGDTDSLVKVVTAEGAVKVLTIKSKKVDVYTADGEKLDDVKDTEALAEVESYLASNERGGIAKIDTNASGEITTIYFPGAKDFASDDKYVNDADNENRSYSEKKLSYGTISVKTSTIVFNDDTDEEDLEDAITVSTVGALFVDGSSYSFIAYSNDKFDAAEAIVTTDASTAFDPEAPVMVVSKIVKAVADDDETYKITGVVAGQSVSVVVDPDEVDETVESIEKGNVIIYSTEPSGFVKNVYVLFASNEDGIAADVQGVDNKIVTAPSDDDVNVAAGWVTEKKNGYFVLDGNDEYRYTAADEGANYTVVEYSKNTITVKSGSLASVKESKTNPVYVFVKTVDDATDEVTDVVIFVDLVKTGYEELPAVVTE